LPVPDIPVTRTLDIGTTLPSVQSDDVLVVGERKRNAPFALAELLSRRGMEATGGLVVVGDSAGGLAVEDRGAGRRGQPEEEGLVELLLGVRVDVDGDRLLRLTGLEGQRPLDGQVVRLDQVRVLGRRRCAGARRGGAARGRVADRRRPAARVEALARSATARPCPAIY
jgi:hypothetical protein